MSNRRRSVTSSLVALGLICAAAFGSAASADTQALKAQFQAELDAVHEQYKFPGATAAFILPDGTVEVVATGVSDLESKTPMSPHSRMLAASIGKMFVGATVLALAQEGRLRLDDPISTWLGDRPWFPRLPNHDTITLRQLLNHSSGIPDHIYMENFAKAHAAKWQEPGNPFPPEAIVEFVFDQPALFEAGKGWNYTDTGYILIGLIIQKVATDSFFYDEVQRRFIEPLGLTQTSPSNQKELPGLASGYLAPNNRLGLLAKTTSAPGVLAWNPALEWTGGGFVSNPRDLVVWAKALFEGKAMPGCYLEDLLKGAPTSTEHAGGSYGAGVGIKNEGPAGRNYGHGGWIPGYVSSLRYYPEYRIAVSFQINTDIGIADDSTNLYEELENRLAKVVASAVRK